MHFAAIGTSLAILLGTVWELTEFVAGSSLGPLLVRRAAASRIIAFERISEDRAGAVVPSGDFYSAGGSPVKR